jgi:hypothetical protein
MNASPSPRWPVHPFLFALYPVLLLWGINASAVPWREGLILCVGAAAVGLVAQTVGTLLMRDRLAGAMLASLVVAITFTYGRIYAVIVGVKIGGLVVGRHRFLLTAVAIVVCVTARYLPRSRKWLATATGALNVAATGLIVMAVIPLVRQVVAHNRPAVPENTEVRGSIVGSREPPDIYYIIADGYGAASTLETVYGFSNAPFLQTLKDRGFYVANDSRSNYVTTVLSLTSSLNMNYIPRRQPGTPPASPVTPDDERIFQSLGVARYLRQLGYAVVNARPAYHFGETEEQGAKRFRLSLQWNSLSAELLRSSVLTGLAAWLLQRDVRLRTLGTISALLAARRGPGPKFVYAHLLAPHPPFVFAATGEPIRHPSEGWSDRAGYVGQVQFVNTTLLSIIDSLRQSSSREPVIILQGDHGPASEGGSWAAPTLAFVRERVPILNAYRVPGRDCPFYQGVTPVNSFRVLFNCLFQAQFALLPDSSFFSSYENQYEFQNVTERLAEPLPTPPAPPRRESPR